MKRKILGRNVFDPRIFLMLCSGTENQKHGSQNNQKNSNAPLLESREFVGVSVSRKSFYVHHGYFGKQIAFVRSFFSGIFILFSIDGVRFGIQPPCLRGMFLSVFVFARLPRAVQRSLGKQPRTAIIRFHKPIRTAIADATIKKI